LVLLSVKSTSLAVVIFIESLLLSWLLYRVGVYCFGDEKLSICADVVNDSEEAVCCGC